jgi:Tol biopolymer transport system component
MDKQMVHKRWFYVLLVSFALLLITTTAFAAPSFSPWEPAASLESVPGTSSELNTPFLDGCPMLSRDGLQLYMASTRPGGLGGIDIWVAERPSPDEPFGAPANVGAPVNTSANEFCPSLLRDGHGFLFASNRPGGCGGDDIYMTRWHPQSGWEAPTKLGCEEDGGVNSAANEAGPVLVFAEPGPPTLYFSSTRAGNGDLYMSQKGNDWSFGPAEPVPGVNSTTARDMQPSVSQDGREMVFASDRPGSQGLDIWSANRDSIADSWSVPVNLGPDVNSAANETRPSLSWDGTMLLFGTNRPGVEGESDIFYATRDQVPAP